MHPGEVPVSYADWTCWQRVGVGSTTKNCVYLTGQSVHVLHVRLRNGGMVHQFGAECESQG